MLILAYYAARGSQDDLRNLRIAVAMPVFIFVALCVNTVIVQITPVSYDPMLLRLDCGVSEAIYHWTLASSSRFIAAAWVYAVLPLVAAVVIGYTTRRARLHLLSAILLAAVLAVPCYILLPAVGPAHIGQRIAVRNCMPSLHLTWAMLLWLNAHPNWMRRCVFGFALLTAFATLATGEHYAVDLLAAVPFTWAVQELSRPAKQ